MLINVFFFCWHRFLCKYNLQRKSNLHLASMECFILVSASAGTMLYFVTVLATASNSEINRTLYMYGWRLRQVYKICIQCFQVHVKVIRDNCFGINMFVCICTVAQISHS